MYDFEIERGLAEQKSLLVNLSRGLDRLSGRRGAQPQPDTRAALVSEIADAVQTHLRAPGNHGETRVEGLREILTRAAVSPATTTAVGWAAELASVANIGALEALAPASAYAQLSARGIKIDVSGASSVRIPMRSTSGSLAAGFVGEGAAIPVKSAGLSAVLLEPKKLAVLTYFSAELAKRSRPSIEAVIRQILAEDTAMALDAVFLGSAAGSAIQPPGLLYGVTPLVAATGNAALPKDIGALIDAISPSLTPVLVGNQGVVARLSVWQSALPLMLPIVVSGAVSDDTLIAIDAAALATGEGDTPSIDIGIDAVVHGDTVPLPIATGAQGSGVLATPSSSLWQQNLIGLRLLQDVGWAMRASGKAAIVNSVTW